MFQKPVREITSGKPRKRGLLRTFPGLVLIRKRAEFPAAVAFSFRAGLDVDGDRCPRVLGVQVGLKVVGQVVGFGNGNIPGHNKVELDEDPRPRAPGLEIVKAGINARVLADDLLDPFFIRFRDTVIAEIGE
jgi:hypothetical protein